MGGDVAGMTAGWGVKVMSLRRKDMYVAPTLKVWTCKVVLRKKAHNLLLKNAKLFLGREEKNQQAKSLILKLSAELFPMSPDVWRPGSRGGHSD